MRSAYLLASTGIITVPTTAFAFISLTLTLRQQQSSLFNPSASSTLLFSSSSSDAVTTNKNNNNNNNNNNNSRNFWGAPRNKQEIIDFVSSTIFYDISHDEAASNALNDNVPPSIDQHLNRIEVISEEPPLVIVHGFLESEYCDDIINAVLDSEEESSSSNDDAENKNRLKRSTMGQEQEVSQQRTSSTAWLHPQHCPAPLDTFSARTSNLSGLPTNNGENLQVVRYLSGEQFQVHTDHLDSFNEMDCGGRLATCLLYLNDSESEREGSTSSSESSISSRSSSDDNNEVFTGGETMFHHFNRAVSPRKGSALFWWNTVERPGSKDYDKDMFLNVDRKLRHAGLPVLSGEKWVANKWLHPLPFPFGV